MPGARWFPGAVLNYAEHVFAGKDDAAVALVHASELRPLAETTWAELRAQTAAVAAGLRRPRRRARRPGRRLPAEHPRGGHRLPRLRVASARSGRPARPTSACAPSSTASPRSSRRCCSPSTATATAASDFDRRRRDRADPGGAADARAHGARALPRREQPAAPGRPAVARASSRTPAELRFAQLPFDHPLWVLHSSGTTGPAEGDRPRPGRDPARAPEDAPPPLRRAARRPALLVHDDRLDDVEPARRRPADRGADRPLRRHPRATPTSACSGISPRPPGSRCFGTSAAYIAACMKAGVEPAAGRDLSRLRSVGSTGSPLCARGVPLGLRRTSAPTRGSSR